MSYKYVVKQLDGHQWIKTYFDNVAQAKKLCDEIIKKGGRAVWMKNAS